jgi:hypothetical protein
MLVRNEMTSDVLPKDQRQDDPVRRWYRPDRHFFANGACQVLAFAFLERYPDMGFHARWIKPAVGFTGNHIYATDGINAFDYHGLTTEQRLLALDSSAASDCFLTGTPRWWIFRPTFSFPNNAGDKSQGSGSASQSNSFTTRCFAPETFSTGLAI